MITEYRLHRRSSFRVESCAITDTQCGTEGARVFEYDVEIATDNDLDEHGFIIDSRVVRDYFTERYTAIDELPSCERIAARAAVDFAEIVGPVCRRVTVTVGVDALAGLTAVWERPSKAKITGITWHRDCVSDT